MSYVEYTVQVYGNGTKIWYLNGELHREDGPAFEDAHGTKSWYLNGKRHREDGPACEWAGGAKEWWLNGYRHREDGPAIVAASGHKFWYLNGEKLSKAEFNAKTKSQSCEGKIVERERNMTKKEIKVTYFAYGWAVGLVMGSALGLFLSLSDIREDCMLLCNAVVPGGLGCAEECYGK